jgi:hypothetical protein
LDAAAAAAMQGGQTMKYSNEITSRLIVIFTILLITIWIGAQYFCVRVYAPWILDSNDKQAIAFMCSPMCK